MDKIKGDEDMLAIKKEISFTTAKTSSVIKAIMKSNKKHSKMMEKLAK
ncbi:hypothetical protein [Desulfosporosinus sp. FKA]|nr:hypothetical protein [Desulfosporosinus sp. FKA]